MSTDIKVEIDEDRDQLILGNLRLDTIEARQVAIELIARCNQIEINSRRQQTNQ